MFAAVGSFVCFNLDKQCIEHSLVDAKNDAQLLLSFEVLWVCLVGNVEHAHEKYKCSKIIIPI